MRNEHVMGNWNTYRSGVDRSRFCYYGGISSSRDIRVGVGFVHSYILYAHRKSNMTTHAAAFLYRGYTFQQEQDWKRERERIREERENTKGVE